MATTETRDAAQAGCILTMGEILVEIMATERGQSFRRAGTLIGPYASGAPAIFIDQVARAGSRGALIGCVGDDDFGALNVERLRADGVDVSGISVVRNATTGSAFVTYREDGERDFIYNIANSASGHLSVSNVRDDLLADCTHFHVMGSSLFSFRIIEAMKKVIETVKAQGGTVSFDPNIRKEMLRIPEMREALDFILDYTDVFLPSGHEVMLLASATTEEGAIEELLRRGVREVVVKRGKDGCSHHDGSHEIRMPALRVEEVDPTGAGDCFGATYIACRSQGFGIEDALRYACASGARAVTFRGPMEGTATLAQLDAFIAQTPEQGHA
ncbi:Fructokinase [Caballeronia glathei]|uniref:Sugar kinase n=1 Tax=Caballeronia glathei TaxID=60547 RepID=A0A069PQ31_9BURK|nr:MULTISPECIES: sugar kinase [Burkholderiaceae]KDR42700.1 sugar kinase [Caballeronia glathei]TCK38494.1 sugar/nucleoside kinase (ribokinase family) [Paraburkholderia sp. BL8N3]CDY75154.1 Fructokinase [Caballeronia glathei]